jgi:rhomboid family protein
MFGEDLTPHSNNRLSRPVLRRPCSEKDACGPLQYRQDARSVEELMFPIQNAVPTRYPAIATWLLIGINCGVFLFQLSLSPAELDQFVQRFALVPARYSSGAGDLAPSDYLPFFMMMFLHGGWLHLIFNMWTLWLFGAAVEDRLGHIPYLFFYVACGLLAAATHTALNPNSAVPALGASGAIAGVMGCYVRMFPFARIVVVIPILFLPLFFEMPALVFVGIWFLLQVLQGTVELLTPFASGGVAWWAHVGGFLAGLVFGPLLAALRRSYRPYYADEGVFGFNPRGTR